MTPPPANEAGERGTPEDQFYLQDSREYVGNAMVWWKHGHHGYVCDIREAHVFTRAEAEEQNKARSTDIPWPKSFIDARIVHHIDKQSCRKEQLP